MQLQDALVLFAKQEIAKKEAQGFDASIDPEFRALKEELEKRPIPELFEELQRLFKRGPLHLEQLLMKRMPHLKMYRGLPRLYQKGQPTLSKIHPAFSNLEPLLALLVENEKLKKLDSFEPKGGKVTLLSWVLPDGFGDYYCALEAARLLQKECPALEVQVVALVHKEMGPLPGAEIRIEYAREEEIGPEIFPKGLLESQDLILEMPVYIPRLHQWSLELPWQRIGEYGFVQSAPFFPGQGRSLGLHFLEKGILIRDSIRGGTIENRELSQFVEEARGSLYLLYLFSEAALFVYLHAILGFHEASVDSLDLVVPDGGRLLDLLQRRRREGLPFFERPYGIGTLEIVGVGTFALGEGKKLRIFPIRSLSPADFHTLLYLSDDFVAIRGDQSLSEAISIGKPFFFDPRDHSRYFIKDLLALGENRLKSYPGTLQVLRAFQDLLLHNLSLNDQEWVDELAFREKRPLLQIADRIAKGLAHSTTMAGFKELCRIIRQEHSANPFLIRFVKQFLAK